QAEAGDQRSEAGREAPGSDLHVLVSRLALRGHLRTSPVRTATFVVSGSERLAVSSPKNRTGPVSRARLLNHFPEPCSKGHEVIPGARDCYAPRDRAGRLGTPLLRAGTGTLHVLQSSPGIMPEPNTKRPAGRIAAAPGVGPS